MSEATWRPEFRCCWCSQQFVRETFGYKTAWVCPTEECRDRQLKWRMDDLEGNLFYLPNPRQVEVEEAVASRQFSAICFGGSRGGSKSICWRRLAQRYCLKLPNFTVLFLRRELKPLARNHLRFAEREAKLLGGKYVSMKHSFLDTDSVIEYGHCADKKDWDQFIGSEADLIIFEQLEQFEETQFKEIGLSAGRTERSDWRGTIGASENPNGPSSDFVNTIFVKKDMDRERFPNYRPERYHFIFSHLEDNPYVSQDYVDNIALMDEEKRDMYRFGRRDTWPGQFFKKFNATTHVQALHGA